jgi:hypothetical protein
MLCKTTHIFSVAYLALLLTTPAYAAKVHHHHAPVAAAHVWDNVKTNIGSIDVPGGYTCAPEETEATCHASYETDMRDNAEARAADIASMKLDHAASRMDCPDDEICMVTVPIEDDASVTDAELDAYRMKRIVDRYERNR